MLLALMEPINFDIRLIIGIIITRIQESSYVPLMLLDFALWQKSISCCLLQPQVWFTVFIWSIYLFLYVFLWQINPTKWPMDDNYWFLFKCVSNGDVFGECLCCVIRGRGKKFIKIPIISVIPSHTWKQNRRLWKVIQCTYIPEDAGHISPAAIISTLNLFSRAPCTLATGYCTSIDS